jgi:hypothetical protein
MVGGAFGHVFLPWVMERIAFGLNSKNVGKPITVGCDMILMIDAVRP